jgi:hydroxymethylglutaryl-CoA reductase (NADPH)
VVRLWNTLLTLSRRTAQELATAPQPASSLTLLSFSTLPSPAPPTKPVQLIRFANGAPQAAGGESHVAHASYAHSPLFTPSNDNWVPLSSAELKNALEANALEGGYVIPPEAGGNNKGNKAEIVLVKQLSVAREDGEEAAAGAWRKWLLEDVSVVSGDKTYTYADLCYGAKCASSAAPKLEAHPLHHGQETITLLLRAPSPDTPSLSYLNHISRLPAFTPAGTNTTVRVSANEDVASWNLLPSLDTELFAGLGEAKEAAEHESNTTVRNVRWFAYAARLLVVRFYTLAKNADSADVFVVLLGYILMHASFVQLFINMRKLGSNFWLGECLWRVAPVCPAGAICVCGGSKSDHIHRCLSHCS